jgi:aminopeptidase
MKDAVMRLGSPEQVAWVPEIEAHGMEWADVYFGLRGASNLHEHDGVPAETLAAHQKAMGAISAMRWEKTRWCLVLVPDETMAVTARTSAEALLTMFLEACALDWTTKADEWQKTADSLTAAGEIRLVDTDTDLSFSTRGRRWVVFAGEKNLPDGEIATAPVVESLNGRIAFNLPGVLGGRIVEGIRLAWKDGTLVEATSSTNQDFLRSVLETDEGSSVLGEFGIGVNPRIDRFSYDILYDEKMVGTVHAALGRAYPECGGTNESSIHWDIVHDMRHGGRLMADGREVSLPK